MRESTIEKEICKFAKDHGCIVLKLAGEHDRGKPDRLFIKSGKVLFMEIKAPGKRPTPLQEMWLRKILEQNVPTGWTDSVSGGISLLREHLV
jgi:Holliday junction resolvase